MLFDKESLILYSNKETKKILNTVFHKKEKDIIWRQNQIIISVCYRKEENLYMNNPVYLVRLILELSKLLICEFWYD